MDMCIHELSTHNSNSIVYVSNPILVYKPKWHICDSVHERFPGPKLEAENYYSKCDPSDRETFSLIRSDSLSLSLYNWLSLPHTWHAPSL